MNTPRRHTGLKITLSIVVVLAAIGFALWKFVPYQSSLEDKLRAEITARGFEVKTLELKEIDLSHAVIAKLELGGDPTITAKDMEAQYVLDTSLRSKEALARIFSANVKAEQISVQLVKKGYVFDASNVALDAKQVEGGLEGPVALHITASGLTQEIPPLSVKGKYRLSSKDITTTVHLEDAPKTTRADVKLTLPLAEVKKGKLQIVALEFPYGGGTISTGNVAIPLAMNAPIKLVLQLENVELSGVLEKASEGKIKATGAVKGSLPITYMPDGTITLQEGGAEALSAGLLSVAPEALPAGTGAQMDMVRQTLQNFHYDSMKIAVSSGVDKKSQITFTLEGRNPEAFGGKKVKLNVNLTGDLIPLIQQSLLAVNDVRALIQQEEKQ